MTESIINLFSKKIYKILGCQLASILSKGITFSYAGLAGVVMRHRFAGLTLPNDTNGRSFNCYKASIAVINGTVRN